MLDGIAQLLDIGQAGLEGVVLVFMRVGAVMVLLPGFGERMVPARVRIGLAIAFTMVVWPMIAADIGEIDASRPFYLLMVIEAGIGLLLGLGIRLMVMALQFAGSVASQSTALAQILGSGATPDPMPAIGNFLLLAGLALAVATGMHVKAALTIAGSYQIAPVGMALGAGDVAEWGTAHVARAFGLGFSMAAPFVLAAFAYNLALGAINKAMPQLMVAFIGAPAITAGGILILMLAAPVILQFWSGRLDDVLLNPLAMPR